MHRRWGNVLTWAETWYVTIAGSVKRMFAEKEYKFGQSIVRFKQGRNQLIF